MVVILFNVFFSLVGENFRLHITFSQSSYVHGIERDPKIPPTKIPPTKIPPSENSTQRKFHPAKIPPSEN